MVVAGIALAATWAAPAGTAVAQPVNDADLPAVPLGLELYMPFPETNPPTFDRIGLGHRLFLDPVLSADRTVACASCHRPEHAFADTVARSRGVEGRRPARHTPSLLNAGYRRSFFWDGRTDSLEEQVLEPIADPDEMGLPLPRAAARLSSDPEYVAAFERVFRRPPAVPDLARALASYVRSLRSGNSALDRFSAGDTTALTPLAREGYRTFLGPARCAFCHGGPLFSDGGFHNTGVGWGDGDPGRAAVTGREEDRGAFKTPSLRDVARSAPYMHDGSLGTLEEVVEFYDRGANPNPHLDPEIGPLHLTPREREALVAFLRSLSGG